MFLWGWEMDRFSIIVPVYNVEKYLHECVKSVLEQTFCDFELILVDDGSSDSCPQICDQYVEADSRVRVIHKQNGGLSSARNAGLDAAVGEYVLFLDSDDYWCTTNVLEIINRYITDFQSEVYIFGMKKYFQNKHMYSTYQVPEFDEGTSSDAQIIRLLMKKNYFVACACDKVVKRTVIENNNMRFTIGQMSEDIEWCTKMLLYTKSIQIIPECFYIYRQENMNSITANISKKNLEHILHVIAKYAKINNEFVKHFIANQYVLWMTTANRVSKNDIKDLIQQAKRYWFLLEYNWYPYVGKVSRVKFLRFDIIMFLLGIYRKLN